MRNHIAAMAFAFALCATPAVATERGHDDACVQQEVCVLVPETDYNGDSNVTPNIKVTVCFTDREHAIITRPDGTNEWVVHLRYHSGSFERIVTMHNVQCREQWVTSGTKVAVYVTCPEYTGWVTTEAITHDGEYVMERVEGDDWSYTPS